MKKTAKRTANKEEETTAATIPMIGLAALLHRELREFVVGAGMEALQSLLEQERTAICGSPYHRNAQREATRGGHANGSLVMGGRRVTVRRPRARTKDKREVVLPSWSAFSSSDPLNERAVEQMVVGVATRKYARSLEPLAPSVVSRGTSKSAVSRRFVELTEQQMAAWLRHDLSHLDLVAMMIDGICFKDHVMLLAIGIDVEGRKHVLGLHEGATENDVACTGLITGLRDRGFSVGEGDGRRCLPYEVHEHVSLAAGHVV